MSCGLCTRAAKQSNKTEQIKASILGDTPSLATLRGKELVQIAATRAALIKPEWRNKIPSPAYDSMTPSERREIRHANPWSYLNVTLSPEDIEDEESVENNTLTEMAQQAIQRIRDASAFAETSDCIYLYRLQTKNHIQTAVVVDLHLSDYESGAIKVHEQVREHRAQLLADHLIKLKVTSSPIACMFQNDDTLRGLLSASSTEPTTVTIENNHLQIRQIVWKITDPDRIKEFKSAFSSKNLYIIDGHHRAAASQAARKMQPDSADRRIFGALFPHDELRLLGFNRWIKPSSKPNAHSKDTDSKDTAKELIDRFNACKINGYKTPANGEIVLYLSGCWLTLPLTPTDQTDASALHQQFIQPYFKFDKPDHPRIINLPGDQPMERLKKLVDDQGGIGIFIAPLSINDFMDIADAGHLLPPKSTYFTPKVQSGVFLRSSE